jgi:hypothetical protein
MAFSVPLAAKIAHFIVGRASATTPNLRDKPENLSAPGHESEDIFRVPSGSMMRPEPRKSLNASHLR